MLVSHTRPWASSPSHGSPPYIGAGLIQLRLRLTTPVPHVTLQFVQSVHELKLPFTIHCNGTHVLKSFYFLFYNDFLSQILKQFVRVIVIINIGLFKQNIKVSRPLMDGFIIIFWSSHFDIHCPKHFWLNMTRGPVRYVLKFVS